MKRKCRCGRINIKWASRSLAVVVAGERGGGTNLGCQWRSWWQRNHRKWEETCPFWPDVKVSLVSRQILDSLSVDILLHSSRHFGSSSPSPTCTFRIRASEWSEKFHREWMWLQNNIWVIALQTNESTSLFWPWVFMNSMKRLNGQSVVWCSNAILTTLTWREKRKTVFWINEVWFIKRVISKFELCGGQN